MTPRKPVEKPNRREKGQGTVYQRADGLWIASIELPPHNGNRRRRVVSATTEKRALAKLNEEKKKLLQHGDMPTGTQTLKDWLDWWWDNEALKEIRPKTAATYRSILNLHIIPSIGNVRLDKLTTTHVRKLADDIKGKGLSSTTALQAHRILSTALKSALREGKVTRNIAAISKAPKRASSNFQALTIPEAVTVLRHVAGQRLESLFYAILFTGAREGELLGLELDRAGSVLDLSWQLQRLSWRHGCGAEMGRDPQGRAVYPCARIRGTDCPQKRIEHPADWEHRHLTGGLWLARPKSDAGTRVVPVVEPFKTVLAQRIATARMEPNPYGLVWTTPDGQPLDPGRFSKAWDALLRDAGVTDVRLHDGRHTAVDFMLAAGVSLEVVKDIVGHSTVAMTLAYRSQGNLAQKTDAMNALSGLLELGE